MDTSYDTDVVAWANEQAALLRAGKLDAIDVLNIAEEIEDVGKSEKRELRSDFVVLIGHLLKWKFQGERHGKSWRATIRAQRAALHELLRDTPSLKHKMEDEVWLDVTWKRALALAQKETEDLTFPEQWIWSISQVLDDDFWPD
jgi:hypothetical protein